jgi:hypothetical protein
MAAFLARRARSAAGMLALVFLAAPTLAAQGRVTSPKEQFGWNIGDDYRLATYTQLTEYWRKLDTESDRLKLVSIGKTAEGRDQWMMIITSPANHAKLDRLREISGRLGKPRSVSDGTR